jgi:hypothetical protein
MTTNNTGYEGWTNYETWLVPLWIDNDCGTYQQRLALVQEVQKTQPEDRQARELADRLKEWIEEENPCSESSLHRDLLGAALSEVNWLEIAEHFLAE